MSKKRGKHHHEEHLDETWLIPYADLLTLLLALFIILFASSQIDSKKYEQIMRALNTAFTGGTAMFETSSIVPIQKNPSDNSTKKTEATAQAAQMKKETEDMEKLKKELDQYIQDNKLTTQLETSINSDMLKITIRDQAIFNSGSAQVKPEAQKLAVAVSSMLSGYPGYNIEVSGYTDNVPIHTAEFDSNWDLSSRRSLNFMKYLLQGSGVDPSRYRSTGYGEYKPIDTNATAEGRARNRRVEVSILRNIKEGPLPAELTGAAAPEAAPPTTATPAATSPAATN